VRVKRKDGVWSFLIKINGKLYGEGDLISFTHDGIRFTWRVQGGDDKKLKFLRIQARLVE